MTNEDDVRAVALQTLYSVLDELNEELPADGQLAKDPTTQLYVEGGGLDSIDLVRLVALLEGKIATATGRGISLGDDRAMSAKHSPFRTVGSLIDYVVQLLQEPSGA